MESKWVFSWLKMRFQDTPGTYTRPSSNSLWRDFFHLGGLWMPGVCSRGMLGFSNGPNECCWHGLSCCVENLEFSELWAIRIHFNYIGCFGRQDVLSWNYIESAHYFLQAHEVYLCTCENKKVWLIHLELWLVISDSWFGVEQVGAVFKF